MHLWYACAVSAIRYAQPEDLMSWMSKAVLATLCCAAASAATITFTETQNGSGSLNGTSFSNALVTIVLTSDTSTITAGLKPGHFLDAGTATVTIAGFGAATFTDTMEAIANQDDPDAGIFADAGIGDETSDLILLATTNSGFSTYDLNGPIGPLSGAAGGNPSFSFPTSDGAFILISSENADLPATFSATLGSVPEPGTLWLLSLAFLLLLAGGVLRRTVALGAQPGPASSQRPLQQ